MKRLSSVLALSAFILLTAFITINVIKPEFLVQQNPQNQQVKADPKDYDILWKRVDSLMKKELPKTALEVVQTIYSKAKTEQNNPQFIKAIIYKTGLREKYEEDFQTEVILEYEKELKAATNIAVKATLNSMVADLYWNYYEQNRWNILDRSNTVNFDKKDIKTWSVQDFVPVVINHHLAALKNKESLQAVSLKNYDLIIVKENKSKTYRPTLYDFLAHRALDFFMSTEPDMIRPANKFEIDKEDYFAEASKFTALKISTKDTLSMEFYALKTLQDLIKFHLNDPKPDALVDVDLKRLAFVKVNAGLEKNDTIYLKALESLLLKYSENGISAEISYKIATLYFERSNLYDPDKSENYRWDKQRAAEICRNAITKFPSTEGANNCKILLNQIQSLHLQLTTEEVSLPDKAFRAHVQFKNLPQIYLRLIKLDPNADRDFQQKTYGTDQVKKYINDKPIEQWTQNLNDEADYQQHSSEIKMPGLQKGYYVLLASTGKGFSLNEDSVAVSRFWVSNISYVKRSLDNGTIEMFVTDRETGKGIENAGVVVETQQYDSKTRSNYWDRKPVITTGANGYVKIPQISGSNYSTNYCFEISYQDDLIKSERSYYYRGYRNTPDPRIYTYFFLDRKIYRPGQTVYFKGISLISDGEKNALKVGYQSTVRLVDANYQDISELELTTNEYGTFSGSFVLPKSGLTGNYHIRGNHGDIYFSVEEYKRPKFEVTFQEVKGVYKLDEKVTVKGNAKAYAGSNVDGATVKYRVVRQAIFPYWGWWWRSPMPTSPSLEIINGEIKTNQNGEFEIEFTAIPDKKLDRKLKPTFYYTVYADVTDINGETHSANRSVSVGYTALLLNLTVPSMYQKDIPQNVSVSTTNLNGSSEPASVHSVVYRLKAPDNIFRSRYWSKPDKYLIPKEEYKKLFPDDIYSAENEMENYEKGEMVFERTFKTGDSVKQDFTQFNNLAEGTYVMEANTTDKFGETIETKSYFTVFSATSGKVPVNSPFWFQSLKNLGEPGETVSFLIGTKVKNMIVLFEIENQGEIVEQRWITLNDEVKKIDIPVKEEYRGNFAYHLVAVHHNRTYSTDITVNVPRTDKKLDITFESFRDKLQPGQQEEWKIRIKGKNGEKVAAEMLASMYDASLDAFASNYWYFDIWRSYYAKRNWDADDLFSTKTSYIWSLVKIPNVYYKYLQYDQLNWFGMNNAWGYGGYYRNDGYTEIDMVEDVSMEEEAVEADEEVTMFGSEKAGLAKAELKDKSLAFTATDSNSNTSTDLETENKPKPDINPRTNFNETAFFFPQLQTDSNGDILIKFTVPESLTRWKMMGLAHTKDLKSGMVTKELVTQKDLMILSNPPRFFREGDQITFSAKVSNITDKDLAGKAELQLFDAITGKPADDQFKNLNKEITFNVKAGQSDALFWNIEIPFGMGAVEYKIYAYSGQTTDGEANTIPILSNRMLVTESLPLPINGNQTKNFTFNKLKESGSSTTLRNFKYTLEFTSNPAWYAVQALPYLMEYPYECSEQTFSRFYANTIASYIANSNPKIKKVFDSWKNQTPDALLSNLEKNQELKALMLEETPWVMQAKNESERKQRLGLLFDLNTMAGELEKAKQKLIDNQESNGGWAWFKGGPDNRYITQYIITGFGHLYNLKVINLKREVKVNNMVIKGIMYLDNRMKEDYDYIMKHAKYPDENHLDYTTIQYLYCRSFLLEEFPMETPNRKAYSYFLGQAKKYWAGNSIYLKGMLALALNRNGDNATAFQIMKSIKEYALYSEEMGMYWKNESGWYWYQAPIETQALLIEAFDEVSQDSESVEKMKIWLLKQKQTQDWKTTTATAEACYALLLKGTNLLASDQLVEIKLGNQLVDPKTMDNVQVEAGTGYFKTSWNGAEIKPEMGDISVTKKDEGVAWGAVYWQYFENLDKITFAETPLAISKKLFVERNTASGPVIEPVTPAMVLKVGDKIKVRIELRVDRDMEYVHMKDMRAAGFEPVNVFSQYKWQGGLGYYESTRDAATNFFFPYLSKGTYVFEYQLFVTHTGDFSNGITTIQCMYAPEFTSHSEGVRVKVGGNSGSKKTRSQMIFSEFFPIPVS